MVKYTSSEGSAYEVAHDVTAEEAAKLGLVVVEQVYNGTIPTPVFGRYKDAPSGSSLGITVPDLAADTKVIGVGGNVGPAALDAETVAGATGSKGDFINPNDPVLHGGADPKKSVHKDGADPIAVDAATELSDAVDAAREANKKATKGK